MTDPQFSNSPTSQRRKALLAAIRADEGTWDWRRAQQAYNPRPEPHIIRRDLQELCKAGLLKRVTTGEYEAVPQ